MFAILISTGSLFKIYPPLVPSDTFNYVMFFLILKISVQENLIDIPCLKDISLKDTGILTLLKFS